jgi:pimeloyl-ACP methyl ester carboxylesterase
MKIIRFTTFAIVFLLFISINLIRAQTNTEKISFFSCDTVKLKGEICFADSLFKNMIVINVFPSLTTKLTSEINFHSGSGDFFVLLKNKILSKGITYFEFAGRRDSIIRNNIKIPSSTMFTKEQDLEAAIAYVGSRTDLKNTKIILMGASEGGSVCAITASKNQKISAIVLLAAPCIKGFDIVDNQHRYADTLFMQTFGRQLKDFDSYCNNVSSLKNQNYEHTIAGFHKFTEDTFEPLENIVHSHDNYDTIAIHVIEFLKKKWEREDDKTRNSMYKGDFQRYCQAHMYLECVKPQSIALRKWDPNLYFPKIKCPVLTVNGTNDKRVECYSTIENMRKLLKTGGNDKLTTFLLKGYDHSMDASRKELLKKDTVINNIVDWILKQ